jgi:predicted small secreted protein
MPPYFVIIASAFIIFVTVTVGIIDVVSFVMSPINIKDTNEFALLDNVSTEMMNTRHSYNMSNNTSKQEEVAFFHTMYCREGADKRIIMNYTGNGVKPNSGFKYC